MASQRELLHRAFVATIFVNGAVGVLDLLIGLFFIFKDTILTAILPYAGELGGSIISWGLALVTEHAQMGIFYFFSHGLVKLFLVWGLYMRKLWAYPISIAFLSAFTLYQLYTLITLYSLFVLVLLIINTLVIILISQEYRAVRKILKHPYPQSS